MKAWARLALGFAMAAVVLVPAAAGAHGGAGQLGIESTVADGLTIRYVTRLTYQNDGDPVSSATVTISASGPAGTVGPVPMSPLGEGRYEATVTLPSAGTWTATATALEPPATVTQVDTVVAPPSTSTSVAPSTTTAASGDAGSSSDDGGSSFALGAGAVALVLLAAGAGGWFLLRTRR